MHRNAPSTRALLRVLTVGPLATNCYIVACPETREAVIIDPGWDAQQILAVVRTLDLKVRYVVNTHAHWDHIGANGAVISATGAQLALHPGDLPLLRAKGGADWWAIPVPPSPPPDLELADGETLSVGTLQFHVLFTPGHTPGHISLYEPEMGAVFDGDVLFARGIGRTDLPGGNYETLMRSIREKLLSLPDETRVYPGHGSWTTIGEERVANPFLVEDF
ncbi:MBL fold metallo-hydrolase [Thermoflexus sp.]|uniref:MBL fold metallo-hydrolase n=1 Tax=Thermoflexus sp. TaxID=1969742 RepID=UPI0035E440E6